MRSFERKLASGARTRNEIDALEYREVLRAGLATAEWVTVDDRPGLKIGTDLTDKVTKAEQRRPHFEAIPAFPPLRRRHALQAITENI